MTVAEPEPEIADEALLKGYKAQLRIARDRNTKKVTAFVVVVTVHWPALGESKERQVGVFRDFEEARTACRTANRFA